MSGKAESFCWPREIFVIKAPFISRQGLAYKGVQLCQNPTNVQLRLRIPFSSKEILETNIKLWLICMVPNRKRTQKEHWQRAEATEVLIWHWLTTL